MLWPLPLGSHVRQRWQEALLDYMKEQPYISDEQLSTEVLTAAMQVEALHGLHQNVVWETILGEGRRMRRFVTHRRWRFANSLVSRATAILGCEVDKWTPSAEESARHGWSAERCADCVCMWLCRVQVMESTCRWAARKQELLQAMAGIHRTEALWRRMLEALLPAAAVLTPPPGDGAGARRYVTLSLAAYAAIRLVFWIKAIREYGMPSSCYSCLI